MHKVTLADGTVLSNLELNGNNYISNTVISDDVFDGNLAVVEISDGKQTQVYKDMKIVANQLIDGKSWFILGEKTRVDKIEEENAELRELLADAVELILMGGDY
jgi:hypothetical protein